MIGELDLDGIFVSPVVVSAVIALVLTIALRRILALAGLYRVVWHPALFDSACFVIVWAIVTALPLPQLT